jgi:Trypsin-like peptidase domain
MEKNSANSVLDRTVDPWSRTTTRVTLAFGETDLGAASGFFWQHGEDNFLITNWHVIAGRDANSGQPLKDHGGVPDRFTFTYRPVTGGIEVLTVTVGLGHDRGWLVHPKHGRAVDVVAIPLPKVVGWEGRAINRLASEEMAVEVGRDAFVLGYPFGNTPAGLPIWKRASLASEPGLMDLEKEYYLIDTASRPGMSGAPVILRAFDGGKTRSGTLRFGQDLTSLYGVYAGRLVSQDPNDLQLGRVWPSWNIAEVVTGGVWEGTKTTSW